jgi:aryl-alcohol dehydrogenase-like predicted oxidoreductase
MTATLPWEQGIDHFDTADAYGGGRSETMIGAWMRARATSMAGLALAWLLADERITQIVVGPGRPEHLAPVREAIERPLSSDERATLDSVFG